MVSSIPATATTAATIIIILSWSSLNAPNLDPINPPANTTTANGARRETSIGLLIECASKPIMEFVTIKKLAVAAALFGSANPLSIRSGDNHMPPPIPTKPATTPNTAPTGTPMSASFVLLKFNFLILFGWVLILLLEARSAAEAANSATTNMRTRLLSGSTSSPAKRNVVRIEMEVKILVKSTWLLNN